MGPSHRLDLHLGSVSISAGLLFRLSSSVGSESQPQLNTTLDSKCAGNDEHIGVPAIPLATNCQVLKGTGSQSVVSVCQHTLGGQ